MNGLLVTGKQLDDGREVFKVSHSALMRYQMLCNIREVLRFKIVVWADDISSGMARSEFQSEEG